MVRKRGVNYEWNPAFNNGRDPEYEDIEEVMNLNVLLDAVRIGQGQSYRSKNEIVEEASSSGMRQGQRRKLLGVLLSKV